MSRSERRQEKRTPVDWFRGVGQWFANLKTWKKVTILVSFVVILALIIVGVMLAGYAQEQHSVMYKETPEDYDLSLTAVDGYINILLLGVDSRDMDNIEGTRSDAIMVVSINEETNDVKIISTYRDTYLKMGDTSTFDKITHACVYGGPEMTMKSLNQAMDLNIENYVVVNFKAVADLVDAVGGITVDVEDYEIQQLNKYTIQTAKNIGREDYQLVKAAGTQTLEGVQAVSYGRIRKGVGDDFKRTERMRTVLTLVFNKMKTMSFSDVKGLIELMTPQVQTNLDMNNILALASKLPSFNIQGSVGWPYNVTSGYISGVSYVLPVDLAANATKLHQEMFLQEDFVPSQNLSSISAQLASRIQAARDAQEIKKETDVKIDEKKDPTKVDNSTTTDNSKDENTTVTDPSAPTDPTAPTDPSVPTEPGTPGTGDTTTPSTPTDPSTPGTGDTTTPTTPSTPSTPTTGDTVTPSTPNNSGTGDASTGAYDDPEEQGVSEQGT